MNYFVIDFETSGFECENNAVTEVGISVLDGETLQELETYQSYVEPYDKIYDTGALKATNISMDLLRQKGKPGKIVWDEMEKIMSKYSSRSNKDKLIWVGQNPLFDIGFINVFSRDFSKNVKLDKYFTGKEFGIYFIPDNIDTILFARTTWQRNTMPGQNYKLESICERAGIELTDAHGALNDTKATGGVFTIFSNLLRNTGTTTVAVSEVHEQGNRFRTTFEI